MNYADQKNSSVAALLRNDNQGHVIPSLKGEESWDKCWENERGLYM